MYVLFWFFIIRSFCMQEIRKIKSQLQLHSYLLKSNGNYTKCSILKWWTYIDQSGSSITVLIPNPIKHSYLRYTQRRRYFQNSLRLKRFLFSDINWNGLKTKMSSIKTIPVWDINHPRLVYIWEQKMRCKFDITILKWYNYELTKQQITD